MTHPNLPLETGLSCGDQLYCGRWWLNTWLQTFSDGLYGLQKTPLILTRGYWLGAHRHGAVLWSSDIMSTFEELTEQAGRLVIIVIN